MIVVKQKHLDSSEKYFSNIKYTTETNTMKKFKDLRLNIKPSEDDGFYVSKTGEVVLNKAIGEKQPTTKRIVKGVFEGFDLSGFKTSSSTKAKRPDHQEHTPRTGLGDKHPRTHIDDAQMNKNMFQETGHMLASHIHGDNIEEVGSHSDKLTHKMSKKEHKAFHHYTTQKSDSSSKKSTWASSHIAEHFLTTHRNKTTPTAVTKLKGKDKNCAEHLKTAAKPIGHETHLYSGVHPSFAKAIKHAAKHTDGVVHSPSHISATHDLHTAAGFALHQSHDTKKNDKGEHIGTTTKHVLKVHATKHDKGIHMSGVEGNRHAAEAETVLPPNTHLKYTHTTHHYHEHREDNGIDFSKVKKNIHRVDVHHCTIHKQD